MKVGFQDLDQSPGTTDLSASAPLHFCTASASVIAIILERGDR
jgi:hypothetical protein